MESHLKFRKFLCGVPSFAHLFKYIHHSVFWRGTNEREGFSPKNSDYYCSIPEYAVQLQKAGCQISINLDERSRDTCDHYGRSWSWQNRNALCPVSTTVEFGITCPTSSSCILLRQFYYAQLQNCTVTQLAHN